MNNKIEVDVAIAIKKEIVCLKQCFALVLLVVMKELVCAYIRLHRLWLVTTHRNTWLSADDSPWFMPCRY